MVFVLLPLIGAGIGWITNVLAIKLLFRPLHPVRIGPFSVQGLIPKRRDQIAANVGDVVAERLFSVDELASRLDGPALQREVELIVKNAVDNWCNKKMVMLPGSVRQYCNNALRDLIATEVARQFPKMTEMFFTRIRDQVDVKVIVADKIIALSLTDVEGLVLDVARRELKQIEVLGAVLGFIVGLFQALLVYFMA
ncbi:MAG: DUF445 family protein [Bacillota bacterium]|nr:DUF445 family protein [Bacillota bacterium]MDW7684965.1 DUF445 family protein [Bacillota bacterium]